MKNNREQIEKIVEYAGKRKINLPADLLLSIAKSDAQELVDTLEKVPEFWEADKITGIISPAHLPLYTKKTPGIVPPPKEDGLVLMSDGWHFPPVVTNITSVTGGTRGGGGGGVTDHALLTNLAYATSGHTGFQPTLAFPLVPNLGGTGVANLAASTLTLGAATTITGGGVIGLGGFTGTVSITGTFAMGAGTLTAVTVNDVTVAAHTHAITGFQPTMTFPLAANLGGTGVANLVASTLTLGAATSITGGGTLALGGFTLTVPATGTTVVNSGVVAGQLVKGVTDTNHITAAAIIPPASNILTLTNAAASTLALAITAGKTLTLTATDNYTLTVPATGTAALLNQANSFTLINPITTIAESWIGPSSTTGIYFKGGFVGIGTTSPGGKLNVVDTLSTQFIGDQFSSDVNASTFKMRKARGTGTTIVANGDYISSFEGWGYDGAVFRRGFYFASVINGTPSAGVMPTDLVFAVNSGGTDATEMMRIAKTGNVGIGAQIPGAKLSIVGSADRIQLQVRANATQTTNLFTCETSAYAVLHSVSGTGITSILSTVAGALVIGAGTASIDYNITFDGETNDGVITWMEDEDYFQFGDDIYLPGGENIVLGTATGTKIGTATSQLLGFYNATPVDQPATVADPSGGLVIDTEARAALVSVIDRLQELGLIA